MKLNTNFLKKFIKEGKDFQSTSDTEVILHLIKNKR